MENKHYINEIGTTLILDTGVNIGSAADQYILYRKPDGTTTGSFDADLFSSYSQLAEATGTYLISHTLADGDLDQVGEWRFHAYVASIAGTWHGEMVKAQIFDTYQ